MQVSVLTTSNIERRLIIGVPADIVDVNFQTKIKHYAKQAKIDGFRPGKVPITVVMQRYGKSIRRETISELIETYYVKALEQSEITPVSPPNIEKVIDEPGSDFKFEAVVEVWPEVSMPAFDKIEIEVPVSEVNDATVDELVARLQKQKMVYSEVTDRPAEEGMRVTLSFEGRIDGEVFDGGKSDNLKFTIGADEMIPGFDKEVVGLKVGETKTFNLSFPEDYGNKDLAGQNAAFTVTPSLIEAGELPALDEAFFKGYESDAQDLESFKAELGKNMTREIEIALRQKKNNAVLVGIIDAINFKVPKSMVQQQASHMRDHALRNIGLKPEDYRNQFGTEMFEQDAIATVQKVVVLREMQRKFELEVSDDALDAHLRMMSERYDDPEGFIAKVKGSEKNLARVKDEVLEQQLIDFAAEKMTIKPVSTDYFELLQQK